MTNNNTSAFDLVLEQAAKESDRHFDLREFKAAGQWNDCAEKIMLLRDRQRSAWALSLAEPQSIEASTVTCEA